MDFWDFNAKYLDSIKPVEQTAAPKSAAKSDKWNNAKEDEIKDDKQVENTPPEQETTNDEQPDEQPAESESENNG